MIKLKTIGFWHSFENPTAPDPAWFLDHEWDITEKEKVIRHLKTGQVLRSYMGFSWCRFRCGNENLGASDLTDGSYIWPEGLAHYLEIHEVRLPQKFVEHVLSYKPSNLEFKENETEFEYDNSWWIEQKGWNNKQSSFKDILDIGILKIKRIESYHLEIQEKFLLNYLNTAYGIIGKYKAVDEILNGKVTIIKGRFRDVKNFIINSEKNGFNVEFKELTNDEYQLEFIEKKS